MVYRVVVVGTVVLVAGLLFPWVRKGSFLADVYGEHVVCRVSIADVHIVTHLIFRRRVKHLIPLWLLFLYPLLFGTVQNLLHFFFISNVPRFLVIDFIDSGNGLADYIRSFNSLCILIVPKVENIPIFLWLVFGLLWFLGPFIFIFALKFAALSFRANIFPTNVS